MAAKETPSSVNALVNYFSRDKKFQDEKPYTTSFPVEGIKGASVSNHIFTAKRVEIYDVRPNFSPNLNFHGFAYLSAPSSLVLEDFNSRETIKSRYFDELKTVLHRAYPEYTAFAFFDYELRKRSPLYPSHKGVAVDTAQPLAETHVDYTPDGARRKLDAQLSPEQKRLLDRPCDLLNVWRVLQGPNDDWPLCLCDFQTIDLANDIIPNDVVYENSVGEDAFLQENENHRWYYCSHQEVDEVIVWRNTNLPDGEKPRAFHTAFENAKSNHSTRLRQSIEVRLAAFL